MDQPLRTVTDDILVSYHAFDVEDADHANVDDRPYDDWFPEENLTVGQGIVYLVSPGHTHRALVTLQAWAAEPPHEPEGAWEISADLEFVSGSGSVVAYDGMEEYCSDPLDLGAGPMIYHLRVNSRGHQRMAALEGGGLAPEGPGQFRHVEEYLFQFWPGRPVPDNFPLPFRK